MQPAIGQWTFTRTGVRRLYAALSLDLVENKHRSTLGHYQHTDEGSRRILFVVIPRHSTHHWTRAPGFDPG